MIYKAKDNTIVDQDGRQVAVILRVTCTLKAARAMAAYAAQQMNHDARQKERAASQDSAKGGKP